MPARSKEKLNGKVLSYMRKHRRLVDGQLVKACPQGGSRLPEDLKDIFDFATIPVYPTIKRAMGYTQSRSLVEIEFAA